MNTLFSLYDQFLAYFPTGYHSLVSLIILVIFVVTIYGLLKRSFIWLILLILFVPASIPILNNIWQSILEIIRYLVGAK